MPISPYHRDAVTLMFITELFPIFKLYDQPGWYRSTDEWIKHMFHEATKTSEIICFRGNGWLMLLCKLSKTQKDRYNMFSLHKQSKFKTDTQTNKQTNKQGMTIWEEKRAIRRERRELR